MAYLFKVILLGDPRVGKTSIKRKYFGHNFRGNYIATLGVDFSVKQLEGSSLQIWDLAGQTNYQSFRSQFYKGAHGAVIIYDVTLPETLTNMVRWFEELIENVGEPIPIGIVGNKIDLLESSSFDMMEEEAHKVFEPILKSYGSQYQFIGTSALTGENIDTLFDVINKQMIEEND